MAVCLKGVCRAKDQELMKAWIQERFQFHTSRPKSLPTRQLKCTKPSFITNSCLESRKYIYNYSTANFHHLASNLLICDVAYFPMFNRFAKDDEKVVISEKHWDDMRDSNVNDRLEMELSRLRRKGVMKDILEKTPEAIDGIATPPKD